MKLHATIQKRGSQAGFAILETLIAFIILAVGLLLILNFNNTSMQGIADAKVRLQAMEFAQNKLQQLRSYLSVTDWDPDPAVKPDWETRMVNGSYTPAGAGLLANFGVAWTVANNATYPGVFDTNVTVSWTDRSNQAQTLILSSQVDQVDPWLAAFALNKVISESEETFPGYIPKEDNPTVPQFDNEPGRLFEEHPDDGWTPLGPESPPYKYRLEISGDIDKKNTQTITLPTPVVSPSDGDVAFCDFGNSAGFKGANKPIALGAGETLLMNTIVVNGVPATVADGSATAGLVTIHTDGSITLDQDVVLGTEYTITYSISSPCKGNNCGGPVVTSQTTKFTVEQFDGEFLCYAYFQTKEGVDKGWTGSFTFSVSGGVFCHPVTGVSSPANSPNSVSAFGNTSFTKTYTQITTNQTLFIQVASNANSCTAQL